MDDFDDLERWAADARARDAAGARVRDRWLQAQGADAASLAGTLLAFAERDEMVVLTTVAGQRHRGVVAGVGLDFCAIAAPPGRTTLVAMHALAEIRVVWCGTEESGRGAAPGRGRRSAAGDGHEGASLGARMADVLAQAAGQRPRVTVRAGMASVTGDLQSVGSDVLAVQTDGAGEGHRRAATAYVRLASVSEVSFLASG